jgi:histidinol-phosphate aminotransferase
MAGYVPGEQPKQALLCKLNTNENAFAPSSAVKNALESLDWERLRRYPDPTADALRDRIAESFDVERKNVIACNGSDDLLTLIFRSFTSPELAVACLDPTYSLYPELAKMQGAKIIPIGLDFEHDFALPGDLLEQAKAANLLIITRPNAPTGNSFPLSTMREVCQMFDGVVLFDEAYADFADDNCMEFAKEFDNVIVSRTFSKSYALAGLRLGFAVGNAKLIEGLFKVKDSYNLDMLTQVVGLAAFCDQKYLKERCGQIKAIRDDFAGQLQKLGFKVVPSQANFLFAAPPDGDGERYFRMLRENGILVRYFPGKITGKYVRITIGTPEEMQSVATVTEKIFPRGDTRRG